MTDLTQHPHATASVSPSDAVLGGNEPPQSPADGGTTIEVNEQTGLPGRCEFGPYVVGSQEAVRRVLEHAAGSGETSFLTGSGSRVAEMELLLRTVFGIVLALNFGPEEHVSVAHHVCGPAPAGRLSTLRITASAPLSQHLTRWELRARAAAEPNGTALDGLRQLIDTGVTPGFALTGPETYPGAELPADLPLRCVAQAINGGVMVWLDARRDVADSVRLEALAGQTAALIHAAGQDPDALLGALVQNLRQSTFDVHVVSPGWFSEIENSLRSWGAAIGLPLTVRRTEWEETQVRAQGTDVLQPHPWGTNLVVVARDLTGLGPPQSASGLAARLPDGTAIADLRANETYELFDEIVLRSRYLRGGVEIRDSDLVVDVGANIGLFTLYAAAQASDVRVHAFEPVPAAAEALETNVSAYGIRAVVERAALGRTTGQGEFTHYPKSSLQSGLYTDPDADEAIVREYARRRADGLPPAPLPSRDVMAALAPELHGRLADRQQLTVAVLRLSDWIRDRAIDRIHLLKVDAERAEEDVLAGIDLEHWPLIEQVVVEVHDIDGRVRRLCALLDERGFDTLVEQDDLFAGSEIVMLYAWRPHQAQTPAPWAARQAEAAERWAAISSLPVIVTVPPGTPEVDVQRVQREATARGLGWASPPANGSAPAWAEAVLRQVTVADRPVAKAVVVDADNTLWGGVCGEVGPEQVEVDGPFRQVQEFLSEQARAGRALALCSRNNVDDLRATFAAHPDMPLTLDDFATVHATWGAKSDAVTSIADELGIAVESLVLVDDSPAERAEVAHHHPGLTIVELPDDPQGYMEVLRATWQLSLDAPATAEDTTRARGYGVEVKRKAVAARVGSRREYLRDLSLAIDIRDAAADEADRVSQLAARTTQFNLGLRRHTPISARHLIASSSVTVTVRVRDRFGDYGLVGFASAVAADGVLLVRDFFLSCRAMGRNVEWCLLRALGQRAADSGLTGVRLEAVTGARNLPARAFARVARTLYPLGGSAEETLLDANGLVQLDWQLIDIPQAPEAPGRADMPTTVFPRVRWPVSAMAARQAAATAAFPSTYRELSTVYIAPETAIERHIVAMWEDVLGVRPIGVVDDLHALGGDSLAAAVICARLREDGLDLSLADLLCQPTVRGVSLLAHSISPTSPDAADIQHAADAGAPVPASPGQQRIWTAEAIGQDGNAQIIPTAHRITGLLDTTRLCEAFTIVVDRHQTLRTSVTEHDGQLRHNLLQPVNFDLAVIDLTGLPPELRDEETRREARDFFAAPFDLEQDILIRATAIHLDTEDHLLLIAVHHSACDGWSMDVIHRDLSSAYADPSALAVLPPPAPFAHYSRTMADRHRHGAFDAEITQVLSTVDAVTARPWSTESGQGVCPRHHRFALGLDVVQRVRASAQARSASPFHLYLAAYQLLLAATADSEAVVSGVPVANRTDPAYAETVGFFANLVPVPLHVDWASTIGRHLTTALTTSGKALRHAEVPYGLLTQARPSARGLFDNLFTLQPPPAHGLVLPGCASAWAEPAVWPQPFPVMLDLQENPGGATGLLRTDAHVVMPVIADWIAEAYPLVLAAVCTLPSLPLERLRAVLQLPDPDVRRLVRARLRALTEREAAPDA